MSNQEAYQLIHAIGNGSFGEIFLARNNATGEEVAAKVEKIRSKSAKSQLRREAKIYRMMNGSVGIPKVRWFGEYTDKYVLVMDLLGQSLEDLFNYCGRKFTLKTVLLLAYEMISRIETVHSHGKLIHRDIKPENFLIGRSRDRHTVYIIDFGLAKHYCNPATGNHIPCKEGNSLTGTARYASLNSHKGLEQSRRDDLFSIGYVLMYFLRGSLPWQGLKTHAQLLEEETQRLAENSDANQLPPPETHSPEVVPAISEQLVPPGPPAASQQMQREDEEVGVHPPTTADQPVSSTTVMGAAAVAAASAASPSKRSPNKVRRETEEQEKYRLIMEKKQSTSVESLCAGFPEEFERYFEHLSTLAYADTPDYAHLKALFRDLFLKLGYKYESVLFDWEVIKHQQEQQQQEQMDFRGLPAHQPQQHRQSGQQMRQVIRKAQR